MKYFGDLQYVQGFGYVQSPPNAAAALGDDASVMMISGLDASPAGAQQYADQRQVGVDEKTGKVLSVTTFVPPMLSKPYTVFGIELPLWAWLLIAAGVLGAGWIFFKGKK